MDDTTVNGLIEALHQSYQDACDRKDYRLCDELREQIRSLCLVNSSYATDTTGILRPLEA